MLTYYFLFLADTTHTFLNKSWDLVIEAVGHPIVLQLVKKYIEIINKFFSRVPADQLLLP